MSQGPVSRTVHDALVESFGGLDGWFERPLPELQWRPGYPDAWSAAEHLEHVSLVNHFLLLTIGKGCRVALKRAGRGPVPPGESDLEPLAPVAEPGAFDWPPPPHMLPTGAADLGQVRALLTEQRGRCLELLAALPTGEGRLYQVRMSVHGLGRLDMYQWLYFLAQHARYHLAFLSRRQYRAP